MTPTWANDTARLPGCGFLGGDPAPARAVHEDQEDNLSLLIDMRIKAFRDSGSREKRLTLIAVSPTPSYADCLGCNDAHNK